MNEWLILQGVEQPQTALVIGLLIGLLAGLFMAVAAAWAAARRGAQAQQQSAVLETRLADREQHFREQIARLEEAEKRLSENFERLAGRIFEERSQKLSELNTKQLDAILKPLGERLGEFRNTV